MAACRLSLVAASRGYSLVTVRGLLLTVASPVEKGLVDLQHVESSWTKDRTCVSCIGR